FGITSAALPPPSSSPFQKKGLEKRSRYEESREKRIEDEIEPFILSEKYMTEKDKIIRDLDVPGRIQIPEESTGSTLTEQMLIEDESSWIINQLNANMGSLFGDLTFGEQNNDERMEKLQKAKGDVLKLLELMHVQKHDIQIKMKVVLVKRRKREYVS
ncbi:hypothetical protein MKX01_023321, partial [Papaver californicum]